MLARRVSALVVGGLSGEALVASVERLAIEPARTWCATGTDEDPASLAGLARYRVMDPWPGRRAALARLYHHAAGEIGAGPVLLLASGTLLHRGFLSRAVALIDEGVGLVLATDDDDTAVGAAAARRLTRAVLRPGSGVVVGGDVLGALAARGWLEGRDLTVEEIGHLAGGVRVVPRAISGYRPSPPDPAPAPEPLSVTVLIPAHNEEAWIGETLRSLRRQTRPPDEVLVVDDCSSDRTGEVARHLGARVLRTPSNALKAGAQNYGLEHVTTDAVVTLDADTVLHPDAIAHLAADLEAGCDATHGAVLPQVERGVWARGRVVEYAAARCITKRAQLSLGTVLVLSGCVAAFRTEVLRGIGGFTQRTLTEDLDLTWTLQLHGHRVGYARDALAYPAEPTTWRLYKAQMRRWATGLFENISVHGRGLRARPGLVFLLAAAIFDLLCIPVMAVLLVLSALHGTVGTMLGEKLFIGWQTLVIGSTFAITAATVGWRRAAMSLPAYLVVLYTSQYFYLESMVRVWVLRRRQEVWVKGH